MCIRDRGEGGGRLFEGGRAEDDQRRFEHARGRHLQRISDRRDDHKVQYGGAEGERELLPRGIRTRARRNRECESSDRIVRPASRMCVISAASASPRKEEGDREHSK